MEKLKTILTILLQLFLLWGINEFGQFVVMKFQIPIPGNVLGMLILFMLLTTGVIKLTWVEKAATLLIRHLAFFFIPIAVGLMAFGDLFLRSGITILIVISLSAAFGIMVTGFVSQYTATRGESIGNEHSHYSI